MRLESNDIHLWFTFPEEIKDGELLKSYENLLSREEKDRKKRLRLPGDQRRFLISRAAARTLLSQYADLKPQQWRFFFNAFGRPEILRSMNPSEIRFNISHTRGLIAFGVVLKNDIGVDVESVERKSKTEKIASRFFSPTEISDLMAVPEEKRRELFFQYWTLKESYIKARGMGLSLPLRQFSFHLRDNAPIQISFDPRMNDDSIQWKFLLVEPAPGFRAALSVRRPAGLSYKVFFGRTIPLVLQEQIPCKVIRSSL